MIDTHCHLDVDDFDRDRDAVVARAIAAGITGILVPAIDRAAWAPLAQLAAKHPIVRIAIGVHPQVVPGHADVTVDELVSAAIQHRAVAIGETGLDGATPDRERQIAMFRTHIRAAREAKLPLIVHALSTHGDVVRVLREERAENGVMHSYSGGPDLVPIYAGLGFAFSFAGPITYANARRPPLSAKVVPAELLLVETDAPDQSPQQDRGRNEPAKLAHIVAGVAAARGVSPSEIAELTARNARARFAAW